jgi:hypothetical protein
MKTIKCIEKINMEADYSHVHHMLEKTGTMESVEDFGWKPPLPLFRQNFTN